MSSLTPERASDLFLDLTPEKVLAAVEAGGLECTNLCYPLNSFENRVYEVELTDKSRVVAKFYRPERWSEEQILDEHRFLAELDAAEIPVCPMRAFPDGRTLKEIDGIFYCLADRRGGRAPDELTPETAGRLGMLVGRLHTTGAEAAAEHRRPLDAEYFILKPIAFLVENEFLPPNLESRYRTAADGIAEYADKLLANSAQQRIHADLHLGNVLVRDGVLRVLDFDDMATGPAVQDVWLAIPGRDRHSLELREHFLRGYESFRLFDRSSLLLIEPLRGMRLVRYAGWLARRWDDPAFKQGWPHFGTSEYWEAETRDLEDQLQVIRSVNRIHGTEIASISASAANHDELLENKAYFWDWEEE